MKRRRCQAAIDADGEAQCLDPAAVEVPRGIGGDTLVCEFHAEFGPALLVNRPALYVEVGIQSCEDLR